MKFSVSKEKLSHLLYLTSTIVERRNTMPILANVRIKAEKGVLSVAATDLEVSLIGETPADVSTPGSTTVSAKVIYDIVRELPGDKVEIELTQGARIEIHSGQARYKIHATAADEFPNIAGVKLETPVSVDAKKIFEMVNKTAYAVSTDETRVNINGVYVEKLDNPVGGDSSGIRFVATDGHRLAIIDRPSQGLSLNKNVILPRKGLHELRKVLEGAEGAAQLSVNTQFLTLQLNDITIGIRLIDGHFPDYRQVIPSEKSTTVELDRTQFMSAIKRVSLVTTDKSRTVKMKLSDGLLIISSSSPEYGEASDSIAVKQTGEDVAIGFSARYITDLLGAMDGNKNIFIELSGQLGPAVFRGEEDEDYRCIVMPMRFEQ